MGQDVIGGLAVPGSEPSLGERSVDVHATSLRPPGRPGWWSAPGEVVGDTGVELVDQVDLIRAYSNPDTRLATGVTACLAMMPDRPVERPGPKRNARRRRARLGTAGNPTAVETSEKVVSILLARHPGVDLSDVLRGSTWDDDDACRENEHHSGGVGRVAPSRFRPLRRASTSLTSRAGAQPC